MAQIIKHRRGSITQLKDVTARVSELVVATGSIGDLNGPIVFVGESEGVAGAYRPVSKIYQGSTAPTITIGSHGSVIDGTPFYASSNKSLYILSKDGNTVLDFTGNIEGNIISGVTINNLTGTTANIANVSGSFTGSGQGLYNIPASGITGLELNRISEGTATASISQADGLKINTNTEITGALIVTSDITGSNLQLSGNTNIDGNITLGGNITIGNANTDIINFGGEVSSSIVPDIHNAFDLGSPTKNWRNLHISGTAYVDTLEARQVIFSDLGILQDLTVSGNTYLGNGGDTTIISGSVYNDQLTNNRVVIVGTQGLLEDDANFTFDGTVLNVGQGNVEIDVADGDVRTSGSLLVSSTSELKGAVGINSTLDVTGSAKLKSTLEVVSNTTLNGTLTVTGSSILKDNLSVSGTTTVSGATILQNTLTVNSTSELKGAVGMNSTLDVTGSAQFKSTIDVDGEATLSSAIVEDLTQNRIVGVGVGGALVDYSGLTYDGTKLQIGGGVLEIDNADGDLRTSGSITSNGLTNNGDLTVNGILTVTGNTQLQGNLYVSGNVEFLGSATEVHISSSVVEIDDNIIRLNAYSPFERYAGFEVVDSGSTNTSASLIWDSDKDYWLFMSSSGQSSKLIGTTPGVFGSENSLTNYYFPIATGINTIGNSLLTYSGTTLSFNTNKFTINSDNGDILVTGNVTLSYSGGTDNGNNTSEIMFRNSSNIVGFVNTTETTDIMDGLLGYKNSNGELVFSNVIDGGTY